jgi:hypothetical protein
MGENARRDGNETGSGQKRSLITAKAGRKSSKHELKSRNVTLECPFCHLFCHPFNPLQQRNVTEVTLKQEEKHFSVVIHSGAFPYSRFRQNRTGRIL